MAVDGHDRGGIGLLPPGRCPDPPDELLVLRWKKGDAAAREHVRTWMYYCFYPAAFGHANVRCRDEHTAKDMAQESILQRFEVVDAHARACHLKWQGDGPLRSYLWNAVLHGVRDELRRHWIHGARHVSMSRTPEDGYREDEAGTIDMASDDPGPEEIAEWRSEWACRFEALGMVVQQSRGTTVAETTLAILDLWACELRLACGEPDETADVHELLRRVDPGAFRPSRKETYAYLREVLGITDNALYQRIDEIRKRTAPILAELLSPAES